MAQIIKLRRSSTAGKVPTTSDLNLGELAINTNDGRIFFEKNDGSAAIKHVVTSDSQTTGSIEITGNVSGSATSTGSFGHVKAVTSVFTNLIENVAGSSLKIKSPGNDIVLDTGDNDIQLYAGGSEFARLTNDSNTLAIKSSTSNADIVFNGVDSGANITALRLDMSEAGKAIFNSDVSGSATSTGSFGRGFIVDSLNLNDNAELRLGPEPYHAKLEYNNNGNLDITARSSFDVDIVHGDLILTEGGINVKDDNVRITGSLSVSNEIQTANDFIVNSSGRVGINTLAPDYKLDVAGNMGVNEYIYHNGDSNTYVRFQNDQVNLSAGGNVFQITSTSLSGSGTSTGSFGRLEVNANTISIGGTELSKTVADNITGLDQELGTDSKPAFSALTASNSIHIGSTSFTISQNGDGDAEIDTDLVVLGDITAQNYIVSSSITHLTQSFSSGSTVFGDTGDDTHQFTGSLFVSNSLAINSDGSRGSIDVKGSTGTQGFYVSALGGAVGLPTDIVHSGGGGTFDPQVRNLRMGTVSGGPISIYPKHDYMFKLGTAEDNDLLALSGSKVGIGTTSPVYGLDVRNTGYFATAATSNQLTLGDTTNGTTSAFNSVNNTLAIKPDGSNTHLTISTTQISGSGASTGSFGHLLVDGQKPLTPRQKAITGTTTTAVDFKDSNNFKVSLTGDVTISSSNEAHSIGSSGMIVLVQDASGGHTVTLPSSFKTPRGDDIAFTSGSNDISIISYYVIDGSNVAINYMGNFS